MRACWEHFENPLCGPGLGFCWEEPVPPVLKAPAEGGLPSLGSHCSAESWEVCWWLREGAQSHVLSSAKGAAHVASHLLGVQPESRAWHQAPPGRATLRPDCLKPCAF